MEVVDPFFIKNDIQPERASVQVETFGVNGEFQLKSIPAGRLILVAQVDRHLAGHDTIDARPGLSITGLQSAIDGRGVDRGFLVAGDAAGVSDSSGASLPDNFIGPQDLNAINAALFTQTGETSFNTYADINRDGLVNATDKDFSAVNLTDNTSATNRIRPVLPTFKRAVFEDRNGDAIVALSGAPESPVRVGDTFDVTIAVDCALAARTYEFHLLYDPSVIAPVDLVSNGSILENYTTDISGKILGGELGIVNSVIGKTLVGGYGQGTLATVWLKAIKSIPQTTLRLADVMLINIEHESAFPNIGDPVVIDIEWGQAEFHDANGEEVLGLILPDEDPRVDFNDFVVFAQAFGHTATDLAFDSRADLNADGNVDFADFLLLTQYFGRVAVDAPSSGSSKPGIGAVSPSDLDQSASSRGVSLKIDEQESDEN